MIRTIGHGTLEPDAFVELARGAGIEAIVDVRRFPGSRRHPHVARPAMEAWLGEAGLGYRWMPELGGRRTPSAESRHVLLRNPQFRAYADHMETAEFAGGVAALLELTRERAVAVMCAESVWWRCHRRLLADHLVLVGRCRVEHLFHDGRLTPHAPTEGARLEGGAVAYDAGHAPLFQSR